MESLFTHQDGKYGHFHKFVGFSALIHFIYRFVEYFATGTIIFDRKTAPLLIAVHALLSGSSLIFALPSKRSERAPMIWPEFRAHSILFAYRSLVAMALVIAGYSSPATRFATVMATLALADGSTYYYGMTKTTMRDMPFPDWISPRSVTAINYYYSVSQVFATCGILFSPSVDRAFFILFPIQIAAFLMTLVRKHIIGPYEWHLFYALSLGLNYVHGGFASEPLPILFYIATAYFCLFRFVFRANKYVLWTSIGCAYLAIAEKDTMQWLV